MKNIHAYLVILTLLWSTGLFTSCQEDTITEDPEVVYDPGERWILHDNLIVLENSSMTHGGGQAGVLFDETTGDLRFDADNELGVAFELDSACVLNIDMEDNVLVRVVTAVAIEGGEYVLQTEAGTFTDIFKNIDIPLSFTPEYSMEQMQTKSLSNLSKEELSKALTDNSGRIHPTRIRVVENGETKTLLSVKNGTLKSASNTSVHWHDSKIGFEKEFDTQFYIPKLPITVGLEDFGASFWMDLDMNLSASHNSKFTEYWGGIEVKPSNIDFKVWTDIGIEAKAQKDLVDEEFSIIDPTIIIFDFQVGVVPVIVHISPKLDGKVKITVEGDLKFVSGIELETTIDDIDFKLNGHAKLKVPKWHPWDAYFSKDYSHKMDFNFGEISLKPRPLKVEAMASMAMTFSLIPTFEVAIYGLAGPAINLPMDVKFNMGVGAGEAISLQDTVAPEVYIGWGGDMKVHPNIGAGAWLDVFKILNQTFEVAEIPLSPELETWHSPGKLDRTDNTDLSTTKVGVAKEVEVKITDSWELPAPLMFVSWESRDYIGQGEVPTTAGGYWKYPITVSGIDGKTKNTWHPTTAGDHKPYCMVKNGSLKLVGQEIFETTTEN
ncbi:hypothetical protein [Maribellus sp. YY47]|uniref:hypothetical protein n=1 Tax=Maribellus sp. YY47 TaxID=2929486 RepID=UPI0020016369|nr:hypothetical protein [Maribellus sp. YY47]MCK3683262.1 hypothetical protein [Maribellus sp. YY47]